MEKVQNKFKGAKPLLELVDGWDFYTAAHQIKNKMKLNIFVVRD